MKTAMTLYPYRLLLFPLFVLCIFSTAASAQDGEYRKVTAPEVKGMLQNKNVVIINTLSKLEYELQHIPGSINIPINEIDASGLLPADFATPLIFYCMASL